MKTIAFDLYQPNEKSFIKLWEGLSPFKIYDCASCPSAMNEIIKLMNDDDVFILVHQEKCLARIEDNIVEILKDHPKLFIMYVTGGSQKIEDDTDLPRVHYSRRVVPSGQDLHFLSVLFSRLCNSLVDANSDPGKIKLAWEEWESSTINQLLSILAPLALNPKDLKLGKLIAAVIHKDKELLHTVSQLDDSQAGEKSLRELIIKENICGEMLCQWMQKNPSTLSNLARRFL